MISRAELPKPHRVLGAKAAYSLTVTQRQLRLKTNLFKKKPKKTPRDYQWVKSKIPANPIEKFMPNFTVLAGQQTTFSLAQNQCNRRFEIFYWPTLQTYTECLCEHEMLINLLR